MLKTNFLRTVFWLSLALAIGLPLYDYLYIYPSYRELLIKQTESEAGRFVRFLVATKQLEKIDLETQRLDTSVTSEIIRMQDDALLVKLRIFSSVGRIVYSTQASEIGQKNTSSYFVDLVAEGQVYSKVVQEDEVTADGEAIAQAVVETYVPIMTVNGFHGAVEIYYDITEAQQRLSALNLRATLLLITGSLVFVGLLLLSLWRAQKTFVALQIAEAELHQANESLELRVNERTRQLRLANTQLDAILSSVADGLIVTDSKDRIVLMNRVAERLFMVESWQKGTPLTELLAQPELLENITRAKTKLADGLNAEFDLLLSLEQADDKVFAIRSAMLLDEGGEQRGTVLLLQDVTKVRGIERMKSEFVSMAAHELRTPLTMILGYSELLVENHSFSAEEVQEFTSIINDKAVALAAILDDLLDVTRIEEGRPLELRLQRVDFCQLVASSITESKLHDGDNHQFKVTMPEAGIQLQADPDRLLQVAQNLLSNAMKYSPEGGQIEVSVAQVEQEVELAIIDQGLGMSAEQIEHAFDRFYRVDTSDSGIRGTGLGLSIVEYIVHAHGGRIWIESSLGEGTQVRCRLPLG